jgi:hypothetical protein
MFDFTLEEEAPTAREKTITTKLLVTITKNKDKATKDLHFGKHFLSKKCVFFGQVGRMLFFYILKNKINK